ncbi:dihydroorotase, partial [Ruegeria sp. NA]|nr:dihydroorotase [Ruegeria sp. NA]
MTSVLFVNARLIDPEAGTESTGWLQVNNGRITARGEGSAPSTEGHIVDCNGKCLAPGIIDIGVKVCEPGERHKESYRSAGLAA